MTTAEALAVVREALPPTDETAMYIARVRPSEVHAALTLIEERLEELEREPIAGKSIDTPPKGYATGALATLERERDKWAENAIEDVQQHRLALERAEKRVAELEAALRGIEAERDNATAALERMRLELVRVDGMVSRYSQSADAVSEDRARWMERCAELEAALEIEREGNPHRVYCPKCQADLPCESCKRYAVALPAAEERVVELEAALREIEEMERERDIYREAEEMRVIARRALGGGE